ncbi:MAG: hypothetical protein LN416_05570 [Candidatus Thermoplasmatota archaeon]|nr:hypothetical protein [Candidatus Thermoplasmatota archaeon]
MREADRRERLEDLCQGMLYGSGRAPGLEQLVADLESRGHVPERVVGILIRFGQLRDSLQLLVEVGVDARPMQKSMISLSERLGAMLQEHWREVTQALEDEARATAQRLKAMIDKERSREPVPKNWFPLKSPQQFDQFLRELDSAQYLRSALRYLDFRADISPWMDFAPENSRKISFLVTEAGRRRGRPDEGFYPEGFWWRAPERPERETEPAEEFVETFRGTMIVEWLAVLVIVGVLFALVGFLALRRGGAEYVGLCTITLIIVIVLSLALLSFMHKEVRVSDRKIEYWVGGRKRFEALWKDVTSVRIWKKRRHLSAYERAYLGPGWDRTWDLNGDGRMDIVDLGLEISDFFTDLPPADIGPRVEYGLVIRTENEKLELKSGLGFSSRTIQRIFESIARARGAHPHVRLTDTRGQRRHW